MKALRWIGIALAVVIAVVLFLDAFGGKFLDGPLGPIPGGAFVGPVRSNPNPDWSRIGDTLEIEIRPDEPWSLTVWGVELDGELYVPHASGPIRRWVPVALEDPRIRVRTNGEIYERTLVQLDPDDPRRARILAALVEKYGLGGGEDDGSTWLFHIAPRS